MRLLPFYLLLALLVGCAAPDTQPGHTDGDLTVLTDRPESMTYRNLMLLPIIDAQPEADFASYQTLDRAIEMPGFYITEKKPHGRFDDSNAVNTLTVQSKLRDTTILLEGDIIQGGNQDRIIAETTIVPPMTVMDIPVFCVEKGRWHYRENDKANEQERKIYAFTGHFNMGSQSLRATVRHKADQQAVWDEVGNITKANAAESSTKTYTHLQNSEQFATDLAQYIEFFKERFADRDDMVGVVAVSGGRIIGTDVFGSTTLFERKYEALLHSYATEAITNGEPVTVSPQVLESYTDRVQRDVRKGGADRFDVSGRMVHYSKL